ncbi:MAG: MFS transporter [Rubrivivax sp.]|nr:MFS transporter [Rubrivivax sp.]
MGSTQTLAWASSYYLPAIVAAPMARDLGLSVTTVFLAFSVSLVLAAMVGPATGRFIDRHGGRPVLMGTNLLFAAGLAALGHAQGPVSLFGAFALVGVAMGAGLYDAAFAGLVWLYGRASRNPITGITLLAGFASTVGWPLTAWMSEQWGWRGACQGWAALHLVLGLPLNAWLPRRQAAAGPHGAADASERQAPEAVAATQPVAVAEAPAAPWGPLVLLAFVFATTRFVTTGIGAHLPGLMMAAGASLAAAVAVGTLVGPAQVGGRLLEFGLLRRWHPLLSARLAAAGPPLGMGALLAFGLPVAAPFALLHGAGNGIITIAKGTLPLALFGAQGYGRRQGWLSLPAQALQAFAPWLFGLALERSAQTLMAMSCVISAAGWVALMALRLPGSATGATAAPR